MIDFTYLKPDQTALLVIDVQRALFTRPTPIYEPSRLIQTIKNLVDRSKLFGVKVIYIQHSNDSILKKGSEGWQFHPELSPGPSDTLIHKTQGNAFLGTVLQSKLEAWNIQNLVITGLVSHQCIKATSLGGIKEGYQVYLVKGGHSNYRKDAESVIEKVQNELENTGVNLVFPEEIDFS